MNMLKTLILLVAALLGAGVDAFTASTSKRLSTSLFYQNDETEVGVKTAPLPTERRKIVVTRPKKPTIYPISNLDELHEFLTEDDDRLTAIKIHAPWCKTCQKVGLHYKKLASDFGDVVQNGKAQEGQIRCAHVEFTLGITAHFIHEQLQIKALPTLQLYKGTKKIWEGSGHKSVGQMTTEVKRLLSLSKEELEQYVDEVEDDGILEEALEESFFDNAYVE